MRKIIQGFVFTGLLFLLACQVHAQKKALLRFDLEKNDHYQIEINTEQEIWQLIMDQAFEMKQYIGFVYDFQVLDKISDSEYLMKVSYNKLYFKQVALDNEMEYDSDNPPDSLHPAMRAYAALKDASFTFIMSDRGEVTELSGIDELIDKVLAQITGYDKTNQEIIVTSIKKQFNRKTMTENMEKLIMVYPEKKIKTGQTWEFNSTSTFMMPMNINTSYKLTEISNNTAYVELSSTFLPNEDAEPFEVGYVSMSYDLKGDQEGEMQVDLANGMIKSAEINQKFEGTITMNKDKTWPIKAKSTVKVKSFKQ